MTHPDAIPGNVRELIPCDLAVVGVHQVNGGAGAGRRIVDNVGLDPVVPPPEHDAHFVRGNGIAKDRVVIADQHDTDSHAQPGNIVALKRIVVGTDQLDHASVYGRDEGIADNLILIAFNHAKRTAHTAVFDGIVRHGVAVGLKQINTMDGIVLDDTAFQEDTRLLPANTMPM